ncbi:Ig-like domain-containing protein [Herbaspirillum sp. YR522]|uniref:Ig-like domain-containing protein n=1 Tax=Herbaspirillum sp. YR522 TaxID=1144342 RepID=UPI00026F6E30|nr:Ig-like domain-containing protein [Herbaspirillum sp. YR522]EJM98609.1 hypothetical protein PMI40_03953 [Herbaspirillum sp. YR522]
MNDIRGPFRLLQTQPTSASLPPRPLLRRASRLLSLEQRFMFDGAAVATAVDAAHASDPHDAAHVAEASAHVVRAADPAANEGKKEVVFVDTSLANYQALEAGVRAGMAIVEFDGSADGLAQIAQWARDNTGVDAIHILSHGSEGTLNLGSTVLDQAALASESVKAELADIGHALNAGGDLLLYGCDIAAGDDGRLLIADIARLTGVDVAASTDLTGSAALGGNWTLESHVGQIDVRAMSLDAYDGLMTVATLTAADRVTNPTSIYYGSFIKIIDGQRFSFGSTGGGYDSLRFTSGGTPNGGVYSVDGYNLSIYAPTGYTFDLDSLVIAAPAGTRFYVQSIDASGSHRTVFFTTSTSGYNTYSGFTSAANDVVQVTIGWVELVEGAGVTPIYQNFSITDIQPAIKISDGNISVTSSGSGLGGAYKIGDTVTARWNNTSSGDNASGIVATTFDFSQFGGSASVAGTNNNGIWSASYTITAGNIDAVNRNVSVSASNGGGIKTVTDSTNLTVDNIAPTVTTGRISMTGATGTGGVFKIGDVVTVSWNNSASGDNNSDAISAVRVDFSQFGGPQVSATNAGGVWTATYTITAGTVDSLNRTASVTVVDNAGNTTARNTAGARLDNIVPTVVITSNAGSLAAGESATITFNFSEDPGSSFTWNGSSGDLVVAGGLLSAISGTGLTRTAIFTPTANVNSGNGSITVVAGSYTDGAGNASGAAVTLTVPYDTLAPNAPSTPAMSAASDTGVSSSDAITRNTTPTFTGTADAGATVVLYDTNGVTVLGTTVANGSGNWSITTGVLSAGTHVLQAAAIDAAGNASPRSAALVVVIDTTPPTVTIASNVATLGVGQSATITFTFSEDPGNTFTWNGSSGDVVVSGGTLSAISGSGLTRTAIFTPTANLNSGTASITVTGGSYTDVAGNSGGAGTAPAITFDTLAPNAPSAPTMNGASDTGVSSSDGITRNTTPTFTGTAEAGSMVTLYDTDGVTALGSAVATGGNWSITTSVLGEGLHTITARATDGAGNIGARSAGLGVSIDTTPPTVAITSNLATLKSGEVATITFTFSEDPGSTFTWNGSSGDVMVTGGTLSAISGTGRTRTATFTPTANVNSGTASIAVTGGSYTDAAGNSGGAGTTPSLVFDTLAPNAPSAPIMSSASDTGVSNGDANTRNTTPTFTGTAEAGATVMLYDTNGITVLGSTTADGSGNWSITTPVLSEGTHVVHAAAIDAAGNTSARSGALVVVIDTTAPSVAIASNVAVLGVGQTATITFTFSEDPGSTFTWDGSSGDLVVSGGTLSAISGSGLTRTAIFTPAANVGSGTASIAVIGGSYTDAAGNSGGAGTTPSLVFDTVAPNAPSAPVMNTASDTGVSNSDGITRNTTPSFTGTAEAGATVTLYDTDGVTVLGSAVATGGNWSITTSVLGQGAHTITARAIDGAGNIGARSAGLGVGIDTTPPTVVITSSAGSLKSGETATITFTFSEDPGSTFIWDGSSGDVAVTGGTLSAISGSGLTRIAIFTPTAHVAGGTASITVAAGSYTDTAGNNGGAGSAPTLNFNTLVPDAPSVPVMSGASDTGVSSSDGITRNTTPTFTGTAEAGSTVTLYDTDGVTVLGSALAIGGNWSITTSALGEGAHTISARATDGAGNVGARSAALAVIIDTTSPTLAITSNLGSIRSGESATITFTFSEDPGSTFTWNGSSGDVVVTGGTLSAISGTGSTRTAIFTPTAGVDNGMASITVTAGGYTDAAGNGGGAGTTPSLVFDTLAPNASSRPAMSSASDTGASNSDGITSNPTPTFIGSAEAGATVTLYDSNGVTVLGSTTADGSGNWTITVSPLTAGVHEISAAVTDGAGNTSTRSAAAAVTVITTAPSQIVTGVDFSAPGGISGGTLLTSSTAHTLSGSLSAPLGAYQSVQVSLDNGASWSAADAIIGTTAWRIDSVLDSAGSTIMIRVVDLAGNAGPTWSQAYAVDTVAPTVVSVTAPADGTYSLGQNLDFTVHFSEAVLVNTTGTIPAISLTLDTGGTVQATYVSGSGSSDLVFRYTVSNNVQDLTGVSIGAALTGRRQVTDIAGNAVVAALNAVASTAAVRVDGLDPTMVDVAVANGGGGYGAGSVITVVVTFDRPVSVDTFGGQPSFALNTGGQAIYSGGTGTSTLSFTYTVAPGENAAGLDLGGALLLNGATIVDAASLQSNAQLGLRPGLGLFGNVVIDTVAPATPVIDRIDTGGQQPVLGGSAILANGERLTVDIGGATYEVVVAANGSWSLDLAGARPTSGSLALVPGGSYVINVVIRDRAGNTGSASAALTVPLNAAVPPSVLRPALDRLSAFVPFDSWSRLMARFDRGAAIEVGAVGGASQAALAESSYALTESSREFIVPEQAGTPPREGAVALDAPAAQGTLTLGGGFAVTVLGRAQPGAGPVVNLGIADQVLASTSYLEFFVPTDAFAHDDQRAAVYLTATREDGKPLPYWISFNPATGKFVVDAKACLTANVTIKVVAHDNRGKSAAVQFQLRVGEPGAAAGSDASTSGMSLEHAGCIALSEQIRLAAQPHRDGLEHYLARLVASLPGPRA